MSCSVFHSTDSTQWMIFWLRDAIEHQIIAKLLWDKGTTTLLVGRPLVVGRCLIWSLRLGPSQEKWDWDSWSWDQWDNNKSRSWKGTVQKTGMMWAWIKTYQFLHLGGWCSTNPSYLGVKICNFMNFPYLGVNNHESQLFGGVHLGIP